MKMEYKITKVVLVAIVIVSAVSAKAWDGMSMPQLRVEGRYLQDTHGNIVNLHGFAQTYSPFFNEGGQYWDNYNVNGCLGYNQGLIDDILDAGWKVNFLRLHMDPYWSNTPGCAGRYEGEDCFDETRFKEYLDEIFIPMAEYAISKGLYVIMRPPGVCPEEMAVGDVYNEYLIKVWEIVSAHPKLRNHPNIMFELANEPINILGTDGTYGAGSQGHFDNLKEYFQSIVDVIRGQGCENILWVPGLGYQSLYSGYAINPIEGENIGYAVHIYPGWFDEGEGYETFKASWDRNIKPVADFAPIVVTEMDWADEKYESSWGKGYTGTAGGEGFGANFKKITDDSGNVSWLLFTTPDNLARFVDEEPEDGDEYTFLNDPEACPWPVYHWYEEYEVDNYPRPDFTYQSHSDNGDGTYTNPVLFGDFPDPDVIRVGDTYYMVTTTMFVFPGATILKSKDLVNWEYCSNPLERVDNSACYNLEGCNEYGGGQWATSIKYNNGKFYLLFNTNSNGNYLLTATDPEGSWEMVKLPSSFYDPGLFFDEDGKIYVVHGIANIRINELDENFEAIDDGNLILSDKTALEGSHLYKINGYYYLYATYGGPGASQVAFRSTNIYGPYEEKVLYSGGDANNIHQGALIQTQNGEWWTIMFDDKGAFGRLLDLQPITWVSDWPEIGINGEAVETYTKPDVGAEYPITTLPTNDNFRNYKLGMQWGWNHNSDNSKWSLLERPGFLRLYTASVTEKLLEARNTLTQRVLGFHGEDSYGTIAMSIENMQEGDVAGLSLLTSPHPCIGVKVIDNVKKVVWWDETTQVVGSDVAGSVVYLRIVVNYTNNTADFYYSFDNAKYSKIGEQLSLYYDFTNFVGIKYSIFNYTTIATGGYVDIDWFTTEDWFTEEQFYDNSFTGYSEETLTLDDLTVETFDFQMLTGTSETLKVTAHYLDGHEEDVSYSATYENSNPDAFTIVNGRIIAKKDGSAAIVARYKGAMGDEKYVEFKATSSKFPLVNGIFNPSIWADGTFNEETNELVTGLYGFGGWSHDNGIDFSDYKYLFVRLKSVTTSGASFRLYDENSYWTSPAMYDFGSKTEIVVDLNQMQKEVDGQMIAVDPSHLYIIGFWSFGNAPIVIDKIFLSNTLDPATGIEDVSVSENDIVDVYTIMGVKIFSQITRKEAMERLTPGIYIVGSQKVFILSDGK